MRLPRFFPRQSALLVASFAIWMPVIGAPATVPSPTATARAEQPIGDPLPETEPLVIITATRQREPVLEAPAASTVVGRTRLNERQSATFPDALREIPGVMVQKTSVGQGSPFIRGCTGFRNLLLIDGIRLNNSVFREGPNQYWNTVDPFGLDRIEVMLGAGSVLYGTDAIGGTVHAFTRAALPRQVRVGEPFLEGRGLARLGSAAESVIGRIETRFGTGGSWGLHLGGTAKTSGDLDVAELGRLAKTGYDEYDADAKLTLALSEPWRLTLAGQLVDQQDVWRTHRTIHGRSWRDTTVGTDTVHRFDQQRILAYATMEGAGLEGWVGEVRLTISWHRQSEDRERVQADGRRDLEGFDVGTFGATVDAISPLAWGPLSWGAAFYSDAVDSYRTDYPAGGGSGTRRIQGPVADDATYRLFDAYFQQKLTPIDPLDLFIGARFSHAGADADRVADPLGGGVIGISDSWDEVVGSARFLWRAVEGDRLNLFGGVSQGFRAPNLSDLTRFDIARSDEIEIPSPGLEPEKFLMIELGARSKAGPFTVDGAVFLTRIDDLIVRQPTGAVIDGDQAVRKRNASDGHIWGFELAGTARVHRDWSLFAKAAWNDGEADAYPTSAPVSKVEPASRLLPLTGELGVRFERTRFWAELYALGATAQDRLNSSDRADTQRIPPGGTPGYLTLNGRCGWRATDRIQLDVAIENLTNTAYRVHGSGQNEAGIGSTATLTLRF